MGETRLSGQTLREGWRQDFQVRHWDIGKTEHFKSSTVSWERREIKPFRPVTGRLGRHNL